MDHMGMTGFSLLEVWSHAVEMATESQAIRQLNVKKGVPNELCFLLDLFPPSGRTQFSVLFSEKDLFHLFSIPVCQMLSL